MPCRNCGHTEKHHDNIGLSWDAYVICDMPGCYCTHWQRARPKKRAPDLGRAVGFKPQSRITPSG
jgi:hypothetical protein